MADVFAARERPQAALANTVLFAQKSTKRIQGLADVEVEEAIADPPRALDGRQMTIALIDERELFRECLAKCLSMIDAGITVINASSITELPSTIRDGEAVSLILYCLSGRKVRGIARDIATLTEAHKDIPIILMSDLDDPEEIFAALESGVRGYIPSDVNLDVALGVLRLVKAGGIYVPAKFALTQRRNGDASVGTQQPYGMFTTRQAAVVEALRRGKANKIIAYELNMCESTVKVHVRNIMKKLKARNRTEVAYKINSADFGELLRE